MNPDLPSPPEVRAIVVGIERYAKLGRLFDTVGAVAGAIAFTRWLCKACEVPEQYVDVWLHSRDDIDAAMICQEAGLSSVCARQFDSSAFLDQYESPKNSFKSGGFLIVYFCGHGVIGGFANDHYLVLPEASAQHFRCIHLNNWLAFFQSAQWERFEQQLWIVDTCRTAVGRGATPLPMRWTVEMPANVQRCALFACSETEAAYTEAASGPRFTCELLKVFADSPSGAWPEFEKALQTTAARMREQTPLSQTPVYALNQSWLGMPLLDERYVRLPLEQILNEISWPYERFVPYLNRTLARHGGRAPEVDLAASIALLEGLPDIHHVPPVLDFAERIARATGSRPLRRWIGAQATAHQMAELENRIANDPCHAILALWYRDDGPQQCIEAELDFSDVGPGIHAWPRLPAKSVAGKSIQAVIGEWIETVLEHVRGMQIELVIELFLPRGLLTKQAYDTDVITLSSGDELRLGRDHPVLLRCTDRYKAPLKFQRWRSRARDILERLRECHSNPLRWALPAENASLIIGLYTSGCMPAPIWLGFDPHTCGSEILLDMALSEGLPAVLWTRAAATSETLETLQADLQSLLNCALFDLPRKLAHWRYKQHDVVSQTVAFLLDDPGRKLPAMLAPWHQPKA